MDVEEMFLKGMNIQVWGGSQSFIVDNSIKMVIEGSKEELPKLSRFICPLTHTWNSKTMNSLPSHDINQMSLGKHSWFMEVKTNFGNSITGLFCEICL